jgi:polysaccharide export outer membrane protein
MKCTALVIVASILTFLLSSCYTQKNLNYLSIPPQDSSSTYIQQGYEVAIQPGDDISIVVSALNPASATPYNLPPGSKGITVDQDGKILYPQLGALKVEGLTRSQLRDLLITRLKTFLTDPVVTVDFLNFKVTVLGEVAHPGTISLPSGRLNILEAIAQSGDLTTYAKKTPVMVIRENKGRRAFGYVNLLSHSVFSSPYYRLQQNDIVYVAAAENKPTASQEVSQRRLALVTSLVGIAATITILAYNILIR